MTKHSTEIHLKELHRVLEDTKVPKTAIEYWAFKGAYNSLQGSSAYIRGRIQAEDIDFPDYYQTILDLIAQYEEYISCLNFDHYKSVHT